MTRKSTQSQHPAGPDPALRGDRVRATAADRAGFRWALVAAAAVVLALVAGGVWIYRV